MILDETEVKKKLTSSCINKLDNRQTNILLLIFSIIQQVTYRVKSLRVYGLVGKINKYIRYN